MFAKLYRPGIHILSGLLFVNYRLRVASVVRDYGLNEREQAPEGSKSHEVE
ncbi:hypothetical protein [Oceanospirillum beijerinckii]|uniref:hypothetical protein n=1 Tax=Oceanospirillum beijerinckii TaxID=64976 RepID=UPI0004006D53|nr:hypothetical protein [Oceanospirillum beijerinckii]